MNLLAQTRPRSATGILDATFNLYREHFVVLYTIAALVTVPVGIASALTPSIVSGLVSMAGNLVLALSNGATCIFVSAVMLGGPLGAAECYERLKGQRTRMIVISLVTGLLTILGLVVLIVPGVIAFIWTAVAAPAAAIERTGVNEALKRSRSLVRGYGLHVFGAMALAIGIMLVLMLGGGFLVGMIGEQLGLGEGVTEILTGLLLGAVYPLAWVAAALLYYDLRIRQEGADLEAMASSMPPLTPDPATDTG